MATARIKAGICGFTTTVTARMNGDACELTIESECPDVECMAQELAQVDPFQEITFRRGGPRTLQVAARTCKHPACPVPSGIIKAIEVAAGLALPADACIELSRE